MNTLELTCVRCRRQFRVVDEVRAPSLVLCPFCDQPHSLPGQYV